MTVHTTETVRVGFYAVGMTGPGSGAWTRLRELMLSLQPRVGCEAIALVDSPEGAAELAELGLEVELVDRSSRLVRMVGVRRQILDFVRRHSLDVIHVETVPLPGQLPVPALLSIHDLRFHHEAFSLPRYVSSLVKTRLQIVGARRARRVLALTAWAQSDIAAQLRIPTNRIEVIPPPLPVPPDDAAVGAPAPSGVGERYVLALGHLEPRKNLEVLCRAAVGAGWPGGISLVLAGDDHGEGPALRAIAERATVPIVFAGAVNEAEKWRLLAGAELVLVPSTLEGFGIVVLEGIVSGTPVLVSDQTALPEVVGTPEAVLPVHDAAAWAAAVARLTGDEDGRQELLEEERRCVDRFSSAAIAEQLVGLYAELLGERIR